MLMNLDPLLGPDLLHALRAMGHGDEIVLADANFPGTSLARRLIRMDGHPVTRVAEAVLSVLPLDDFVTAPVHTMAVVDDPDARPEVVSALHALLPEGTGTATLDRFAFYDRARAAYAIVQTGETRLYGNVILTKGVVRKD